MKTYSLYLLDQPNHPAPPVFISQSCIGISNFNIKSYSIYSISDTALGGHISSRQTAYIQRDSPENIEKYICIALHNYIDTHNNIIFRPLPAV